MKTKETLEEVAEIFVNNRFTKQICGDESYPDILASRSSIVESHILFAKCMQERSYSEEEVIKILYQFHYDLVNSNFDTKEEWFEQFKKK